MADTKTTGLTADLTPTTDDLVPTVHDPAGTPVNRKVTLGALPVSTPQQTALDTAIAALPSLIDGPEVTFTPAGSPPTATLAPVVSAAAAVRVLGKALGAGVASTSTATSILAATVTPAANSVAVDGRLITKVWGTLQNNTGADATFTFRFRYGSVNLWASGAIIIPTNTAGRPWRIEVESIVTSASSGTLVSVGTVIVGAPSGTVAVDTYARTVYGTNQVVALGGWSALDFTVQHSSAGSQQSTDCLGGIVIEHVKA